MKITVESSKSVKPACAAPATVEAVPLTVFDKANFNHYVSAIYAFHPPAPSNAVLEAGLAKALVDYREWAGRLDGNRCAILLNDAGARFVAATAAVALDTIMPLQPTPELLKLYPSGGSHELMLIQATRFARGSLVVGITAHHKVADGSGRCQFILSWGRATRGASVPWPPPLLHDRPSIFVPRSPLRIQYEHRGVEYKPRADRDGAVHHAGSDDDEVVVVERVHFGLDLIAKLKSQASAGVR